MTLLPWLAGNNGTHGKVCLLQGVSLPKGLTVNDTVHVAYPVKGCTIIARGFATFDEIKTFW